MNHCELSLLASLSHRASTLLVCSTFATMQHVARFCQRQLIPVLWCHLWSRRLRSWFVELSSESLPICYFYGQLGSNIQRLLTAKASQQVGEMSRGWLSGGQNIHFFMLGICYQFGCTCIEPLCTVDVTLLCMMLFCSIQNSRRL